MKVGFDGRHQDSSNPYMHDDDEMGWNVVEIKHKCNLANIKDNESNEREGNEVLQTK